MRNMRKSTNIEDKPIRPIQQRLRSVWGIWLVYRLLALAVLAHILVNPNLDILAGIAWQGLWLVPAMISTPYIFRAKSPYALLVIDIIMLIYLGGSGMMVLIHAFEKNIAMMGVWAVDLVLLGLINYWLFVLLKRLPKMNG